MPKAKEPKTYILWRLCGTHSDYWEPCVGAFSIDNPTSIPPFRLLKLFAQNVLPEDWISKRILVLPLGEYPPGGHIADCLWPRIETALNAAKKEEGDKEWNAAIERVAVYLETEGDMGENLRRTQCILAKEIRLSPKLKRS